MGFLDHIDALRMHIFRSVIALLVAAVVAFIKVEWIFDTIVMGPTHNDFISYQWLCALGRAVHYPNFCISEIKMDFQNNSVTGQFMMGMSVSVLVGFILAFPYIFWEFWRFIKPALKPNEVRYARGIVFWCSVLFFTGVLFSYFILTPYVISFFGTYSLSPKFKNIITIDSYYDTVCSMLLSIGLVFELPVVIYFLSRIGIVTPKFLREQRRYAFLILFILSEIITPPDLFSCLLVFIPLYFLYEASIFISGRTADKRAAKKQAEQS